MILVQIPTLQQRMLLFTCQSKFEKKEHILSTHPQFLIKLWSSHQPEPHVILLHQTHAPDHVFVCWTFFLCGGSTKERARQMREPSPQLCGPQSQVHSPQWWPRKINKICRIVCQHKQVKRGAMFSECQCTPCQAEDPTPFPGPFTSDLTNSKPPSSHFFRYHCPSTGSPQILAPLTQTSSPQMPGPPDPKSPFPGP